MRFKTFVKVTTVTWCCAFIGGFLTGKSAFGDIFNGKPPHNHIECMAKNIYHEAKSQSLAGQMAVGLVVLNRVKSKNFPDDVCKVVYEGPIRESWKTRKDPSLPKEKRKYYPIRHRCQFSWYCDGKSDEIPVYDIDVYRTALIIAQRVFFGSYSKDITQGATHYHADYVFPSWRKQKTKTLVVGNHIFYRWEK